MAAVKARTGLCRRALGVALLACLMALQGCQRPVEPHDIPPITPVKSLLIEASLDVNPNLYGRPSPVLLTVYQLSDADAFVQAGPERLVAGTGTLADDPAWLAQRTFQLRPGESRVYHFEPEAGLRLLAVVAHFQDLDSAHWRAMEWFRVPGPEALRVSLARQEVEIHAISLEEVLSSVQ